MSAQGLYDVIVTAHEAFTHRQFEDGSFADGEDDRRSLDTTIADAVREWAKENAELYFGGYGGDEDEWPQHLAPSHYSVPLDKFGGDE